MQDSKRQVSVLGARKRFDAYVPGKTKLPDRGIDIGSGQQPTTTTEAADAPSRSDTPPEKPEKEPENLFLDSDL